MQASTGIATIDDMVNEFCDAEDQNFSLLNMINSLNKVAPAQHAKSQKVDAHTATHTPCVTHSQEIEALEVENTDMEASLRETKGKGAESEAQRMSVFQVCRTRLQQ